MTKKLEISLVFFRDWYSLLVDGGDARSVDERVTMAVDVVPKPRACNPRRLVGVADPIVPDSEAGAGLVDKAVAHCAHAGFFAK